ncbi:50S ribosomal protein L2 [Roseibacillus persicicus]|uniref:Large ribosomal subunit protein uL2 n=1 Tax=Roseibacillus persicicus TaxID=454148 RepID=A0A918WHM6_9BACT|nr:50S ribosomal protein L2 [Roseibacillus persicicus]MDQ8191841.1 50S ribosomal protein L2 [Roseibacillus persicicus]GHC44822.1 50S ribosomal protein L2 [Roseibacillus persicicus]
MSLKTFKPITPTNRYKEHPDFAEVTKSTPEKSLTRPLKKSGGRNNQGRITCRHIGGGHKRKYRVIDFKRSKRDVEATVVGIEYDPNRTCRIALLEYADGEKAYILAPVGLTDGAKVEAGENAAPKPGNAMPLSKVPLGTAVHNIELQPGGGGKVARSAGQQAILSNRDGDYALVRMPSGEIRRFIATCYCTIGQVGNRDHMNEVSGKAGRTRWQGTRPTVRGMCMNPVDHPNGGGEGKSKSGGGRQHLKSPWGHTKGQKTRKKKKPTNTFIVERRKKKR